MTIYTDNSFAKMWVDETLPCVFTRINAGPRSQADVEELNRQLSNALRKLQKRRFGVIFSITDMTICSKWSVAEMRDFMNVAANEYKMGVTHKFFIRPIEGHSRQALLQALIAIPNIRTNVHADEANALREIDEIRQRYEQKHVQENRTIDFFSFFGFARRRAVSH